MMLGLGFALSASAATLTTDPLTGLPLYPATDSRLHLGNEPTKIPDSQICKSQMQGDFYVVYDSRMDATFAWYAAHLAGFHKAHAYSNGRSRDAFYNDAGTLAVIVTGDAGKGRRECRHTRHRLLQFSTRSSGENHRRLHSGEGRLPVSTL